MNRPNIILLVVLGATVLLALVETSFPLLMGIPPAFDIVASVFYSVCAFAWVRADAGNRNIRPPAGSALLAALAIPIGVPVYFFRVLGFRQGLWGTVKMLGFLLCMVATYGVVSYLTALAM